MEKLKCKFCGGGDLVEMNGTYHCWDCGAKYVMENGELRLLKCKLCIGDLIDCGDHYECELCGKRYEKAVQKPAPVVSAPAPKEEKPVPKPETVVPAPKKPAPKPEEQNEKEFSDWEKVFQKGYNAAFAVKTHEEAEKAIEMLEECYPEAVGLIQDIEDDTEYENAAVEICAKFFVAVKFLCCHSFMEDKDYEAWKMTIAAKEEEDLLKKLELHTKALGLLNEGVKNSQLHDKRIEKLSKLSSDFLFELLKISEDYVFVKMVAERAVDIFTLSTKKEDKEDRCPHIMGIIYGCDENMEVSQEKLTEAYWRDHWEDFEKLSFEKAMLKKETEKIKAEEERAREKEERKTEAIRKEIEAAEKKWDTAWHRSIRLNFFQKKEKKRLDEEMHEAIVLKNNLEEKLKLREKEEEENVNKIISEWAKKDTELDNRIDEIEMELERNHYPNEEDFVRLLNSEIQKAEKDQ